MHLLRTLPSNKTQTRTNPDPLSSVLFYAPQVKLDDLGFSTKTERAVFTQMVGPRYNQGKGQVRLTSEKFANRLENKKHLTYTLEKLVKEAKRISAEHCNGEYDVDK